MTSTENVICTFGVITSCCILTVIMPNINEVMLVAGATSNPIVGFVLPVAYWLKINKSPSYSAKRIYAIFIAVLTTFVSFVSLYFFIVEKFNATESPLYLNTLLE